MNLSPNGAMVHYLRSSELGLAADGLTQMSRRQIAAALVLVAVFTYFAYRRVVTAASEAHPISIEAFERLPYGITVIHAPHTVMATLTKPGNTIRAKYTWWFKTTVSAVDSDVQIVEFGVFVRDGGKWVAGRTFTGKPFAANEFAEWYSCPNGKLRVGQEYSDPTNWCSGQEILAGQDRWYYVGVTKKGDA